MVRIAVVDDEKEILDHLSRKIEHILTENQCQYEIENFLSGKTLLEQHAQNQFHIIFIDLEMPEMTGMEASERIRKDDENVILIFVTNRDDLVYRAFQYSVAAFIRKSYLESELSEVVISAYQKAKSKLSVYLLKTETGEAAFLSDDIQYFVSMNHNIRLHDKNQNEIRVMYTLDKLEHILSQEIFVRCHSGFIVNCNYIFSINKDEIELTTHTCIPLSRYRKKEVKRVFQKHLRSL